MKNSIFILGLVLLTTGITFSQQATGKGVLDRLYFKAGAEFYSMRRDNSNIKGDVNNINLVGSVIYDLSDRVQTEFVYKYGFVRGYPIFNDDHIINGEIIRKSEYEDLTDYNIDLKLNWFLNRNKTNNPIYITGILEFDIQNRSLLRNESHYDTSEFRQKFYEFNKTSYNRLLIGPGIGAGIFLDAGKIDFQAEANCIYRIAPFVDKGYNELVFNVVTGLVYKF